MFYRRDTPTWALILAVILFFTIPWWLVAILGAISSALGGNLLPLILIFFVGMWIIAEL
jgi:hypothetical protein